MGYKETLEVDNTHPVTRLIMGTSAHYLCKLDQNEFIDKFNIIPNGVEDQNVYRRSFIDQIDQTTKDEIFNEGDDLEKQFVDALGIFHDNLKKDYGSLTHDLKNIPIGKLTIKDLHRGFLSALGAESLDNDQLWQIYKTLPKDTRRTFFKKTKYQKAAHIEFKKSKSTKDLIHYLRKNEKIKIKLKPTQIKAILNKIELGDLINLDTLTATTRTKVTDFWTKMSITTYRWSGTVAETATLARYLPFLTTVNKYLVAPVVIAISLIVATHNHEKFRIKEASHNKKFLLRCLKKNAKKEELKILSEEAKELDDFQDKKAYKVIKNWIRLAGLSDDFSYSLDELKKTSIPQLKLNTLKAALANQRDILYAEKEETEKEALYRQYLYEYISKTEPEEHFSSDSEEEEEEIKPKKIMLFNKELPPQFQTFWELVIGFFKPLWALAKELFGPTFNIIRQKCAPYVFPVLFGVVSAMGIIALTCAYTLAPEILIPITIIALIIGVITGVAQYLRDRQHDMHKSLVNGQKNKKHNLEHEIDDQLKHKKSCEILHEIQNKAILNEKHPDNQENTEQVVELHVRRGENTSVFTLTDAALKGLQRNTALNFAAKDEGIFEEHATCNSVEI